MLIELNERLSALRADERGLTTVEYVIVLALIAAASVSLWDTFGDNVRGYVDDSTREIDSAMDSGAR
jgi:Flp pilus assembly pilin Flp